MLTINITNEDTKTAIEMMQDDFRASQLAYYLACEREYKKLEIFFKEVADLTVNHSTILQSAVVYPHNLSKVLHEIDPEWWKGVL